MSIATKLRRSQPDPAPTPAIDPLAASEALDSLRRAIDSALARLGALREPMGLGLTTEERDAEAAVLDGWLTRARALAERFVTARGRTVEGLITSAGGAESFTLAVRGVQMLARVWWSRDEAYAQLHQLEADLDAANRELELLGGSATYYPADSLGETTINRGVALGQAITKLKAEIDARRTAEVSTLVERAIAGDADAVELVAQVVRSKPSAFPNGALQVLLSAAADAQVAVEAQALADEQEQRRQRILLEDRAVALLKAIGPNGVQAMRRSLRTALVGNRRDAEFEAVRIIKVGSNAHGFAPDVPALSPAERRRVAKLLLDLADVRP
jgi:hypothetical protein